MERANPNAFAKNGIKLYYPKAAGEVTLYPNIQYTVAADGSTTDIEVLNASGADYLTVKITDKNGAYVAYKFDPVANGDTQTVDTSTLDASCNWLIRVYAGIEPTSEGCNSANSDYCLTVCDPKGATGTNIQDGIQALFVELTDNGSTSFEGTEGYVAYGSTVSLGTTYTAGDDLIINLAGWGNALVNEFVKKGIDISAVSITGDVTSFTNNTPLSGDGTASLNFAEDIVLDIALAGSYSVAVVVTSTDNAYPLYKFTLTWTAV